MLPVYDYPTNLLVLLNKASSGTKSCVSWRKKGILSFFKQENLYNLTIKLGDLRKPQRQLILGLRWSFLIEINGSKSVQRLWKPVSLWQLLGKGSPPLFGRNGPTALFIMAFLLCLPLSGVLRIVSGRESSRDFQKQVRNPSRELQYQLCPFTSS